jgi:hypothetical protein
VDALDVTLATTQAISDPSTPPPRRRWISRSIRNFSLPYDSGTSTLNVLACGFGAKAPAAFVALITDCASQSMRRASRGPTVELLAR